MIIQNVFSICMLIIKVPSTGVISGEGGGGGVGANRNLSSSSSNSLLPPTTEGSISSAVVHLQTVTLYQPTNAGPNIECNKSKGKFVYSAVSSPQDHSKRFTLYFPDRPVHSDTILASLGSIQLYATINAWRLLVHISTTVYIVITHTAE